MNLAKLAFAFALTGPMIGVLSAPAAWAQPSEGQPPDPPQAPKNVTVETSSPASRALSTQAASAEIAGDPRAALALAERAIAAEPRDPWGHYNKAAALSLMGKTDEAVASFAAAEERYAPSDMWGRAVAIYGAAHALNEAGRCDEARREYMRYADFVKDRDPASAQLAAAYAAGCRAPAETAPTAR